GPGHEVSLHGRLGLQSVAGGRSERSVAGGAGRSASSIARPPLDEGPAPSFGKGGFFSAIGGPGGSEGTTGRSPARAGDAGNGQLILALRTCLHNPFSRSCTFSAHERIVCSFSAIGCERDPAVPGRRCGGTLWHGTCKGRGAGNGARVLPPLAAVIRLPMGLGTMASEASPQMRWRLSDAFSV